MEKLGHSGLGRAGFTLPEVMIAAGLAGLVVAAACAAFSVAARMSRAGGYQHVADTRSRSVSFLASDAGRGWSKLLDVE